MTPSILRAIAYRWHLRQNTLDIARLLNWRESDVYNALSEAKRRYPIEAFPLLDTMLGSVVTR